jgi:hypothetical protein
MNLNWTRCKALHCVSCYQRWGTFNKTTARSIVYGPWRLGGIDLHRLYDRQGIGNIYQFIIKQWRCRTTCIGNVLEITLAWSQSTVQELDVLYSSKTPALHALPHLPNPLIAQLRILLESIGGTIEVNNAHVPPLQRENNWYIMDWVVNYGDFSPAQIKRINYCRLSFNVVTVADIGNAEGTHVESF